MSESNHDRLLWTLVAPVFCFNQKFSLKKPTKIVVVGRAGKGGKNTQTHWENTTEGIHRFPDRRVNWNWSTHRCGAFQCIVLDESTGGRVRVGRRAALLYSSHAATRKLCCYYTSYTFCVKTRAVAGQQMRTLAGNNGSVTSLVWLTTENPSSLIMLKSDRSSSIEQFTRRHIW